MTKVTIVATDAEGHSSPGSVVTIDWAQPQGKGPVVGMNLGHPSTVYTPNKPYEKLADIGRIYTLTGCTDLTSVSEFQRGMDVGIRKFHVSWKDTSTSNVAAMLSKIPSGVTVYGTHHHEPEDDTISVPIATWKARQAAMMPVVRAAGAIPTVCFMAWTLQSASGRNIADWSLPKGLVDVVTYDYYPGSANVQKATVAAMRASLPLFGATRLGIGEYGVDNNNPTSGVQIINAFKPLIADFEFACYWSSQVNTAKPNYRFTDPTAAAWFA